MGQNDYKRTERDQLKGTGVQTPQAPIEYPVPDFGEGNEADDPVFVSPTPTKRASSRKAKTATKRRLHAAPDSMVTIKEEALLTPTPVLLLSDFRPQSLPIQQSFAMPGTSMDPELPDFADAVREYDQSLMQDGGDAPSTLGNWDFATQDFNLMTGMEGIDGELVDPQAQSRSGSDEYVGHPTTSGLTIMRAHTDVQDTHPNA